MEEIIKSALKLPSFRSDYLSRGSFMVKMTDNERFGNLHQQKFSSWFIANDFEMAGLQLGVDFLSVMSTSQIYRAR